MLNIIDNNYEALTIYWPSRCGCSIHWEQTTVYRHCVNIFQNVLKYIEHNNIECIQWAYVKKKHDLYKTIYETAKFNIGKIKC